MVAAKASCMQDDVARLAKHYQVPLSSLSVSLFSVTFFELLCFNMPCISTSIYKSFGYSFFYEIEHVQDHVSCDIEMTPGSDLHKTVKSYFGLVGL